MNILRLLLHHYRLIRSKDYAQKQLLLSEHHRIGSLPRYCEGITRILGPVFTFVDGLSFKFMFAEIFTVQIYKFATHNPRPTIIDAGANIGLSVIYLKQLHPKAKIIAFEPDAKVFDVLQKNVQAFSLEDVTLVNKALWNEETTLEFNSEGADAGRVSNDADGGNLLQVECVRLSDYIRKNVAVDFLKMDIEGAEFTVLKECAECLDVVDRIFVEYHSFVGKDQDLPELLAILKKAGYRLNINSPGLRSKSPFDKVETYSGMDMQLNIYAYRN